MARRSLIAVLATCLAHAASAQQHAQSLGQVPALLQSPEARKAWEREMAGRTQPDLLGETRLAGLRREVVLRAVVPASGQGHATVVGAKPWPQQPGRIVAVACVVDQAPRFDHGPSCDGDSLRVYLSVFSARHDGGLDAVATLGPLFNDAVHAAPRLEWGGNAGMDIPLMLEDDTGSGTTDGTRARWNELDFANYALSEDTLAFGLRGGWSEGYAGGGADFSALYLFALRGNALAPVFAAPVSMLKNIAGDWNQDGTRQHDISEAANILIVKPQRHGGYHDLEMRRRGARRGDTYRWSAQQSRYRVVR